MYKIQLVLAKSIPKNQKIHFVNILKIIFFWLFVLIDFKLISNNKKQKKQPNGCFLNILF
jgi:hypothetical protein